MANTFCIRRTNEDTGRVRHLGAFGLTYEQALQVFADCLQRKHRTPGLRGRVRYEIVDRPEPIGA